jgi:hypothetical protein
MAFSLPVARYSGREGSSTWRADAGGPERPRQASLARPPRSRATPWALPSASRPDCPATSASPARRGPRGIHPGMQLTVTLSAVAAACIAVLAMVLLRTVPIPARAEPKEPIKIIGWAPAASPARESACFGGRRLTAPLFIQLPAPGPAGERDPHPVRPYDSLSRVPASAWRTRDAPCRSPARSYMTRDWPRWCRASPSAPRARAITPRLRSP